MFHDGDQDVQFLKIEHRMLDIQAKYKMTKQRNKGKAAISMDHVDLMMNDMLLPNDKAVNATLFYIREGVKNTQRGGGPSNLLPKAAKPWPPLKILQRTCPPPKMRQK